MEPLARRAQRSIPRGYAGRLGNGPALHPLKAHLHHATWASTKWVSSGTGRPVAPFAAPDFQAVPATSRWAHGYLDVKRRRNIAAVIAPPARPPPMLPMSAKLLFS